MIIEIEKPVVGDVVGPGSKDELAARKQTAMHARALCIE